MSNGKTTGRDALAYTITKGTELSGVESGILKGIWYYVMAKDASTLLLGTVGVGRAFLCSKAVTALAAGDSVVPLTLALLGFVRDKQLDASKTATDSTTDIDEVSDYISDGLVSKTGSLNGYDLEDSPTRILSAQFQHTLKATAGAVGEADTIVATDISTPKQLIMIDWTGRAPVEGQEIKVDIFPATFTAMSQTSSTGSVKTLNFNFTVVADDGAGCKPTHFEGPYRAVA
jgi:hypothetical protein